MRRSPLLERHRAHGVRLAPRPEAPDHETPLFFAPVPEEYAAARTGCALLDVSDHGRVTVEGPDAVDFLHRLLANHVKSLGPGSGNENLLLSPKGKVLFPFELLRFADRIELSTPPGRAEGLRAALEAYRFSERLTLKDTSEEHAPLELRGPETPALLMRTLGTPETPIGTLSSARWRELEVVLWRRGSDAWRLDAGPDGLLVLWDALATGGATPVGLVVRDIRRVEAGRALPGVDIDENVYPQEAGLEAAFALDKGCYVGQEVVAKIDTYGGLNKRLVTLRVDHSDPVARGTKLVREEEGERRELGLVTSWAYSFALDTGMVLAYVKRRHQEPGTEFELSDGAGRARIVEPPCP